MLEKLSRISGVASNLTVNSGTKMEPKSKSETVIAAADEVKKFLCFICSRKKLKWSFLAVPIMHLGFETTGQKCSSGDRSFRAGEY